MKRLMALIITCLFISGPLFAQEKTDSIPVIPSPEINKNMETEIPVVDFELYRALYFDDNNVPVNTDSNSVWLWTSFVLNNQNSYNSEHGFLPAAPEPHMLSNFHDMYIENSKFNVVRTVLAMAEAGFVGYLAIKSIQKHGFWDNK